MDFYEPHTAIGLAGLVLIGVFVVAAAAIPAWIAHRATKKNGKQVGAVLHQVQNNHPTNLRDDIDEISRAVQGVREHQWELSRDVSGIRADIGTLRSELRDERSDRIEADERIVNEHIRLEINRHPE